MTDFSAVRQLPAHSSGKNTGFSVACQLRISTAFIKCNTKLLGRQGAAD